MLIQSEKFYQKLPLTAKLDSVEFGSPQNFSHFINYFQLGQFVVVFIFYFYLFIFLLLPFTEGGSRVYVSTNHKRLYYV